MAAILKEAGPTEIFRFLRCIKTNRYNDGSGWTEDADKANSFPDEIQAVRTCLQRGLSDVELVLRIPGSSADLFSTPIT